MRRNTFGEWLEDELHERGWTHQAFADLVNVSRTTVTNWVNNVRRPYRKSCRTIAQALSTSGSRVDESEVLLMARYPPRDPSFRIDERSGKVVREETAVYRSQSQYELESLRQRERQVLDKLAALAEELYHIRARVNELEGEEGGTRVPRNDIQREH